MSPLIVIFAILFVGCSYGDNTYKDNVDFNDFSWVTKSHSSVVRDSEDIVSILKDLVPSEAEWEDFNRTFEEIVEARGFPVETHHVTTEDGYILTLHRIPYGRSGPSENRSAVFLMHGLLCSSADWIIPGIEKSLAYILANKGYDVWLGNARGNTYSRRHITLDPDNDKKEFWSFSWHEIGYYDLPAMIDYVLAETKQDKLFYVGHSQGTTTFYVLASTRPEYNDKIRAHFSLSPIAYMSHLLSPIPRMISSKCDKLENLFDKIEVYEFAPHSELLSGFLGQFCTDDKTTQVLCKNLIFVLCGFNRNQMNASLLPVIFGHTPAGASTRQLLHYGQEISSGHFCEYDHSSVGNNATYGSETPPQYDVTKITSPVYFFCSTNDWMSAETDVLQLEKLLPNLKGKFINPDPKWNHLDYIYGIDAAKNVYSLVIGLMEQH